jgi:hypothetical protein
VPTGPASTIMRVKFPAVVGTVVFSGVIVTFGAMAVWFTERFSPEKLGLRPGKAIVMMAVGSKEGRRKGTRLEVLKSFSMAVMAEGVSLQNWALARRPRKERETVVVRRNIVRIHWRCFVDVATSFIYTVTASVRRRIRYHPLRVSP